VVVDVGLTLDALSPQVVSIPVQVDRPGAIDDAMPLEAVPA